MCSNIDVMMQAHSIFQEARILAQTVC
jgi:hypothetical protein